MVKAKLKANNWQFLRLDQTGKVYPRRSFYENIRYLRKFCRKRLARYANEHCTLMRRKSIAFFNFSRLPTPKLFAIVRPNQTVGESFRPSGCWGEDSDHT